METRRVFITGGTGYMGRSLISKLVSRGHNVSALVRPESQLKLPVGAKAVTGNALDASSFASPVAPADTFVQLVGVPPPSPAKAEQFRTVDLPAARAGIDAARRAGVRHFVYVSVAHPAPVMHAFIEARREAEKYLRASGLTSTVLRPWYVLGPGHRWPYLLLPFYAVCERLSRTHESALRLGLVSLKQMAAALLWAVENPAAEFRVLGVPEIRALARDLS
jgi:uncharacterized protein YbjT (DUF2867 family)